MKVNEAMIICPAPQPSRNRFPIPGPQQGSLPNVNHPHSQANPTYPFLKFCDVVVLFKSLHIFLTNLHLGMPLNLHPIVTLIISTGHGASGSFGPYSFIHHLWVGIGMLCWKW